MLFTDIQQLNLFWKGPAIQKKYMGLTTWADVPDGKIKKSDVTIAKNYLSQDEMKQLNRMVTTYLDLLRT